MYLFTYFKSNSIFCPNCLVHVSVLSCEHTYTTTQHDNAFQCFIVTTTKTHKYNKADLIVSSNHYPMRIRKLFMNLYAL